jgi:RNA polymerase sigma-70 factor (ECF subfamily)
MLDSSSETDDAVQESWLRLCRSESDAIDNLGGWLTTVVSRVCLDMLRSRASRREEPEGTHLDDVIGSLESGGDPEAFLAASRSGDLDELVAVLDPDIVLRADPTAVRMGSLQEVHGSTAVAKVFLGRALAAQPALVDGIVGVTWGHGGRARVVWDITISGDKIARIDMVADADSLNELDLVILD